MSGAGTDFKLDIDGGTLRMELVPREENDFKVRFEDRDGDVVWTTIEDFGFWENHTRKGAISTKVADHSPFSKSAVDTALEEVWTELIDSYEEYQEDLRSPSVQELLEQTKRVEVHGGEDTERIVWVRGTPAATTSDGTSSDGGVETRQLNFSNDEWTKLDGDTSVPPVVKKYSNEFYETLDITWDDWSDVIQPEWESMQEQKTADHTTTEKRIAQGVVNQLIPKLDVYDDREKMVNDTWNGHWEDEPRDGKLDDALGPVIWVDGKTLDEALDVYDKGIDYRSKLSRALREQGYTVGSVFQTSISGRDVYLYPFSPDALNVNELDVVGREDDDGDEDEGEGGDANDGGDGDDAADSADTTEAADGTDSTDATDSTDGAEGAGSAESGGSDDGGDDDGGSVDADDFDDEVKAGVIDALQRLDRDGVGLTPTELVVEVSANRNIAAPPDVHDAVEELESDGILHHPPEGEDEAVALDEDSDPPGSENLDLDDEGVPDV